MRDILRVIFSPIHWIRNASTSHVLDEFILNALKNPRFEYVSRYVVKLNGLDIWIRNYPYAYGSMDKYDGSLPSRTTVLNLKRAVDKFMVQHLLYGKQP